jgi:hypothetical protein
VPATVKTLLVALALAVCLVGPVRANCPKGDLNLDCTVDMQDFQIFTEHWLDPTCLAPDCAPDIDGIPGVNISDFTLFANDWRTSGQKTGLLRVMLSPQGALDAGAQWRVDGGDWQGSGSTQSGLPVGSHTVEFSAVALWLEPPDQVAVITDDDVTITYGTYKPILVINEFMASNSKYPDPAGECDDWIEIYNAGPAPINVAGMYLTKNLGSPTMWRFPTNNPSLTTVQSHKWLLIWADNDTGQTGLHATFKLDADNDKELGLFYTNGQTLIDSVHFGKQTANISYGRSTDGNDTWQFMAYPTPGSKNNGGYLGVVEDVKFSHDRGFYDTPFSVTIATDTADAAILYTLDGSPPFDIKTGMPTPTAQDYTGPLAITTTTYLRAAALKEAWQPSKINTQTYIFLNDVIKQATTSTGAQVVPPGCPTTWPGGTWSGAVTGDYQMDPDVVGQNGKDIFGGLYANTIKDDLKAVPTFSLVMNRGDWFGTQGIYINESQDGTERPASIEFIDPTSGEEFQINCAMAMQGGVPGGGGGTSLDRWKSFKLSMRPRFKTQTDDLKPTGGPAHLDFQLFPDSPVEQFDTFVFDGVLNHSWLHPTTEQQTKPMYINDQYVADLHNAMGGFSPHGLYAHVYISGLYWGMYYIHERPDHSWAAQMFGGDKEEYDALKHSATGVINDGTGGSGAAVNFNAMLNAANAVAADPTNAAKYQTLCNQLDVDSFITYLLANWFCGNTDWPHKNWYVTHRNTPDGRWRIHSWDAEHTVDEGSNDVGESPSGIHNMLKGNAEYRIRFADLIHKHFFNDGVLATPNPANMYQARMTEIDRAIVGESARWGDNRTPSFPYTRQNWLNYQNNTLLSNLFPNRSTTVLGWLKNAGLYPSVAAPVFYINGSYKHGGYILPTDQFSMTAPAGVIYYTIDGNDPRLPGTSQGGTSVTLASESAAKRVLVPTGAISDNWKGGGAFDDSGWNDATFISGKTGGGGYDADNTTYKPYISYDVQAKMYDTPTKRDTCYIRIPFTVTDNPSEFTALTLRVRYDDGFIAYINGTLLTSRNSPGMPAWDSSANATHSDSLAVVFEDIDISTKISALQQGSNILAIHGLNYSTNRNDFLISAELVATKSGGPSGVSPSAIKYTGPFTLNKSTHMKSRALSGTTWSALNEAVYAIGPVAENLRITEIMYHPQDANDPNEEYIELMNIGPQTLNLNLVKFTNGIDFTFPPTELAAGDFVVVVKNLPIFQAKYDTGVNVAGQYTGSLENAGERIQMEDALGKMILDFKYADGWREITDGNSFSLTIINPADPNINNWGKKDSWRASAYQGGSPGEDDSDILPNPGDVVINEVLAHSHAGAPDWIELANTTDQPIPIGGWYLSDSASNLKKYKIASETSIPGNGYKVFYENTDFNDVNDPGCLVPFALSENGDTVYLSSAENGVLTGYREVEDFGASLTDVSLGRTPRLSTGNYNFVALISRTPEGLNAEPKVGPIVINEIMYNPDWPDGGSYSNDEYEYVELRNIGASSVTLYDSNEHEPWKFTDGIEYTFPDSPAVTIPAGGYIVVVRNKTAFSNRYSSVPSGKIYGPYSGHLNNGGESLELSQPGDVDDLGVRHYIRVDRINYSDGSHPDDCPGGVDLWPVDTDGLGKSLSRKVAGNYGNDPSNWAASAPSPATGNP